MSNEKMAPADVLEIIKGSANLYLSHSDPSYGRMCHAEMIAAHDSVAALIAERDAFRAALEEIAKNDPYNMSSAGLIARTAIDFACTEADYAGS